MKSLGGYTVELKTFATYPIREKHDPKKKFVILTYQRTGSSLLVDLLNSHPNILCESEILLNRMFSPETFLYRKSRLCGTDIYGFKLQLSHLEYQGVKEPANFIQNLVVNEFSLIKLTRRDLFRTALSLQYAIASQKFHFIKKPGKEPALIKISLDTNEFLDTFRWIIYQSQVLEEITAEIPVININYEDDLLDDRNHQTTVDLITDSLEIKKAQVSTIYIKATPPNVSEFINNVDELKEAALLSDCKEHIKSY